MSFLSNKFLLAGKVMGLASERIGKGELFGQQLQRTGVIFGQPVIHLGIEGIVSDGGAQRRHM